jgi:hypothetical protein
LAPRVEQHCRDTTSTVTPKRTIEIYFSAAERRSLRPGELLIVPDETSSFVTVRPSQAPSSGQSNNALVRAQQRWAKGDVLDPMEKVILGAFVG